MKIGQQTQLIALFAGVTTGGAAVSVAGAKLVCSKLIPCALRILGVQQIKPTEQKEPSMIKKCLKTICYTAIGVAGGMFTAAMLANVFFGLLALSVIKKSPFNP